MESPGCKSGTSPVTLKKTTLVPATPLSGNPSQSHQITPTKGEERHQKKQKNWEVQAVRSQRLI